MGFRYLVLGTGMGRAIAHCLAQQEDTSAIVIGDVNDEAARNLAGRIMKTFSIPCGSVHFEADKPSLLKGKGGFDVIISALPARYNLGLAETAISLGVNFCDLGGVLPITLGMKAMDMAAQKKNVSIVPDCGLMPGLGLMIARKLLLESIQDEPENTQREVVVYAGGLPQKPVPPLYYQKMFSLEGLMHLCYDDAAVIKDGRTIFVHSMSDYEMFRVDELKPFSREFNGMVEAFVTSGASLAPWSFRELGVTSLSEKTVRWPGFVRIVSGIEQDNFEEAIGSMTDRPINGENPDLVWMKVAVCYHKDSEEPKSKVSTLLALYDNRNGLSAMEQTTGFTTALIAQAIARGQALPGVLTPDEALAGDSLNRVITETGSYFWVATS